MSETNGRYDSPLANAGDDASIIPYVQFCLRWWSEQRGDVMLSPYLMTPVEIDWHIDRAKEELERIRQAAKEALTAPDPKPSA
jgi:hypothetical protein